MPTLGVLQLLLSFCSVCSCSVLSCSSSATLCSTHGTSSSTRLSTAFSRAIILIFHFEPHLFHQADALDSCLGVLSRRPSQSSCPCIFQARSRPSLFPIQDAAKDRRLMNAISPFFPSGSMLTRVTPRIFLRPFSVISGTMAISRS